MREKLENILFTKLKASLPAEFKTMLVRGHSTNDRHIPYTPSADFPNSTIRWKLRRCMRVTAAVRSI